MDERWREEGDAITWRGQKADTFDIDGVGGPRSAAPSSARDRPFSLSPSFDPPRLLVPGPTLSLFYPPADLPAAHILLWVRCTALA